MLTGAARRLRRRDLFRRRFDAEVLLHLPLQRPGRVRDAGVLVKQRQQPAVADGGRREDGRDAVQALELLGAATAVPWHRPGAGTLVPQQQGDGLELRAHGRRHAAAHGGRFDLTGNPGEYRDDVAGVADAPLLRRDGTASALLTLACSSQKLLLWNAGHGGRDSMPLSPTDGAVNVPGSGPDASDAEPDCGSPRIYAAGHGKRPTRIRSRHRRAADHDTEQVSVRQPVRVSDPSLTITRARAHNSRARYPPGRRRPGCGSGGCPDRARRDEHQILQATAYRAGPCPGRGGPLSPPADFSHRAARRVLARARRRALGRTRRSRSRSPSSTSSVQAARLRAARTSSTAAWRPGRPSRSCRTRR